MNFFSFLNLPFTKKKEEIYSDRTRGAMSVSMCVCLRARACVCVCVCVVTKAGLDFFNFTSNTSRR